ncbi:MULTISPECIES: hypothetical protein [Prochlorococcus]|uniref:hypothetical protein n=1 Tax=Prochlorococcus TaxID=1218 RepID=UPI0007BB0809|nr:MULTISPECIES: hypothetical protein [Prochlorococcus]KZR66721.1 hypothetical protein PMIT1312_00848 [Prochlorococcus marinus str. MIT 1312]KZR83164.1 hypothetical protein PMIT1327_00548 [Prochlorococcus marinus str. MIT 1327]NMO83550.1 hypothetical protein [Prochlorococcus sp. P1344]NMP05902.1 hypothetical protein [Prochlorococcus sp. P1361]NMP12928.1 hypothetical protein [Prochlorococcus sp.P1363]
MAYGFIPFATPVPLRCHRREIELGALSDAIGQSLEGLSRCFYSWASRATTACLGL